MPTFRAGAPNSASDQNTAKTAYQSAVATENATYASKMAGYTNAQNLAIQKAVAAYDQTVAGFRARSARECTRRTATGWR